MGITVAKNFFVKKLLPHVSHKFFRNFLFFKKNNLQLLQLTVANLWFLSHGFLVAKATIMAKVSGGK